MEKSIFRQTVEEELSNLGSKNQLKMAFEKKGKMVGTSISEGGDVDVLYSPKGEVMYIDFTESISAKMDTIKKSLEALYNGEKLSGSSSKSYRLKLSKYKNGKSILFYTWTPNWTVGALKLGKDVVWIEVPYSKTKPTKIANATKSKVNLGVGADDIRPAANVDFLKANPKVEKMLKKASIPLGDIAAQNLKMNKGEKSEKAIKKHAAEWIKANQSTFDSWIK